MPKRVDDERVLREAARLFRKQGYSATTVRQIAKAARMLPGSLHYRYPSKGDILIALLDRAANTVLTEWEKEVQNSEDPIERLELVAGRYLELLLANEDGLHVLNFEIRANAPAAFLAARRRLADFWDKLILDVGLSGKMRATVDPELLREFGDGAITWVAMWYRPAEGRTPRSIAHSLITYLTYGLMEEHHRPKDFRRAFEGT
jgi:AcrR family transcriptional regulator